MKSINHYLDEWDEIVSKYINWHEPFDGYWTKSEERAFTFVDNILLNASRQRVLDLGCGRGRLLTRFAHFFKEVVALDSQQERIMHAKALVNSSQLLNVNFINQPFEDCTEEIGKFDVVLCSHVVQHIPTFDVVEMFKQINSVLLPGGLLVLLTAHAISERNKFKVWQINNGDQKVTEELLESETAFNKCFTEQHLSARIPTHSFTSDNLCALLQGYKLRKTYYFHALYKRNFIDSTIFRDRLINLPLLKGFWGIDVLIVAEKL